MIKCDNLYAKFKCTRIIKTFFTDHSLPTCTCYCQSFRVSLPKPKHEQSFLVVGFVKGKYLRSIQSWKGHANVSVSSGFPCNAVYLVGNILSFSSGKLKNCPFKMGSRKAGFHCTTVKCFAPDIFVWTQVMFDAESGGGEGGGGGNVRRLTQQSNSPQLRSTQMTIWGPARGGGTGVPCRPSEF